MRIFLAPKNQSINSMLASRGLIESLVDLCDDVESTVVVVDMVSASDDARWTAVVDGKDQVAARLKNENVQFLVIRLLGRELEIRLKN